MKKIFMCLLAVATIALVGCKKENKQTEPEKQGQEEPQGEPEKAVIVIDGDFADWDAAPAADLAVCNIVENPSLENLYVLKCITDADYIYFYVEFNAEGEPENYTVGPIDIYMNVDGDDATGSNSYLWENSAADILIEGFWEDNFSTAGVYTFPADAAQDAWAWEDAEVDGSTETSDRIILANGHAALEGVITRAMIPMAIKALKIGVFTSNSAWSESGCLPSTILNEDGTSTPQPLMEVKLN